MGHPLVSVIIATHNRARLLCEAIESVLGQTYGDIEIIVVDDGSVDDTKEMVAARFGNKVRYLYQESGERSRARNTGAKTARGEFLQFFDDDDYMYPEKIAKEVALLQSDPKLGLVYSWAYITYTASGIRRAWKEQIEGRNQSRRFLEGSTAPSGTLLRREAFEQAGGFDEELFAFEDRDLFARIARSWSVEYVPEFLWEYRMHGDNMVGDFQKIRHAMHLFFKKHSLDREPGALGNVNDYLSRHFFIMGYIFSLAGNKEMAEKSFVEGICEFPRNARAINEEALAVFGGGMPRILKVLQARLGGRYRIALTNLLYRLYRARDYSAFRAIFQSHLALIVLGLRCDLCLMYIGTIIKRGVRNDH